MLSFLNVQTHDNKIIYWKWNMVRTINLYQFTVHKVDNSFNHNYYNFRKFDWCINCLIFHQSLYTVVIEQLHRPIILRVLG